MKIGIIGLGYVGMTYMLSLAENGHTLYGYDKDENKIEALNSSKFIIYEEKFPYYLKKHQERLHFLHSLKEVSNELDIICICVNTPDKANGECNTDYLFEAVSELPKDISHDTVIVIKSTIEIGTARNVQSLVKNPVVFCPEFLSQGTALENALQPSRIVIGGNDPDALQKVKNAFGKENSPILITNWETAEMVKYASNAFLATRVALVNEISRLCGVYDIDVLSISKGIGLDDRIGPHFLKPSLGFGGSCFEKDIKSLCYMGKKYNIEMDLIESINESNDYQKSLVYRLAKGIYSDLEDKICTVLGLSFKKGTDDCRNSPALNIVHSLIDTTSKIKLYDPVAKSSFYHEYQMKFKTDLPEDLIYENIDEAMMDSDLCILITDWDEIVALDEQDFLRNMRNPVVIDGRYCLLDKLKDTKVLIYPINQCLSVKG